MYFFFFLIFSNLAVFFGLVLVFFQNPMYSILSLVGCILFSVIILFMYGIEFMSFVYLVVYIGAIAILFLFMIMMLNINTINSLPNKSATISLFLYICIFFKSLYFMFLANNNMFLFYFDSLQRLFFIPTNINEEKSAMFLKYNFLEIQKSFSDNLADLLISGLDSTSELAGFCILYNIYFIYFILAGFILLFAMLGSISLCIVK
jgi:NADH:ubiquinone oxidoreductase subunit 6 (subunit J)